MRFKKRDFVIILSAFVLLALSVALFFPSVTDSIITGFAPIDGFSVGISVSNEPEEEEPPVEEEELANPPGFFFFGDDEGFEVDRNYINLKVNIPTAFEEYITIHNLDRVSRGFVLNHTKNFIYNLTQKVTIQPEEYRNIPIYIDTSHLPPGKYKDYIYVNSGVYWEEVVISIEMVEQKPEEEKEEPKEPVEEKPAPVVRDLVDDDEARSSIFVIVVLIILGLFIMVVLLFFYLGRINKIKTFIKHEKEELKEKIMKYRKKGKTKEE